MGSAAITARLGNFHGSTTVTVTAATLSSIAITPANPSIANVTTIQLGATGTFSDGSMQDLTTSVSWTSAPQSTATVDQNGLVTGTVFGKATITETHGGVSGSTTVTVTAPTLTLIAVIPGNPSIAKGTTVLMIATCSFSDSTTQNCTSQVGWTSGNNSIAEVSNDSGTQGLVTGLAVGSTSVTAVLNGISGSTTVTVTSATLLSIIVTPADPTVHTGQKLAMTATAMFCDGTTQDVTLQADWTSSDDTVVHVVSSSSPPQTNGELQAKKPGTAIITATVPTLGDASG